MQIFLILIAPLLIGSDTDCLAVPGERIRASDLAKRLDVFRQVEADVEIGFAPLPGGRRVLTTNELQRAAVKNGVANSAAIDSIRADICVQMLTRLLKMEEVERAIQSEIQNRGIQNVTVEILDFSRYQVPEGELQFTKAGLTPPAQKNSAMQAVLWRGRMIYGGSRSVPVWARVRIYVEADVTIAAVDIAAAATIGEGDTIVEKRRVFPFDGAPFGGVQAVIGKRTKRSLKKGDPITSALLENLREVERGDKVEVAVSSGAAQLRLAAIAESSGQIGERILIKNPSSGKRFQATVESKGHVTVTASTGEQQ